MCSLDLTRDHAATVCRHVGRAGTVGQGMWDRMGVGGRREEKPAGVARGLSSWAAMFELRSQRSPGILNSNQAFQVFLLICCQSQRS